MSSETPSKPAQMGMMFPHPVKGYHTESYPSISPSRSELSVKGQTVLITGGATGIGLETSKAFAEAGASFIVLLARTQGPMTNAKNAIEANYPHTKVKTYAASITDAKRLEEIAKEVGTIDILVLNAATMPVPAPTLSIDPEIVSENFQVNVIGPLNLLRAFMALPPRTPDAERTVIYTSSAGFQTIIPGTSIYNSSKAAMTYLIRCIDAEYSSSGLRAFAFHPAVAYTDMAKKVGVKPDAYAMDNMNLPAHFAVWLSSSEADFLKGRFLWAHWDVDELGTLKDKILADPSQLQIGLVQDKLA